MTTSIAAILVNYNAGADLRLALQSIQDELRDGAWEAVVVDNASTDDSGAIAGEFARVRLVANPVNVGFSRAVNQGLALTRAPLVLVMNPDCRLMPAAIAGLRAELERDADTAIVGPRILDPDGSLQGSARGDPTMLTRLFGRSAVLRRLFPWTGIARRNVVSDAAVRSGQPSVVVDWVSGACMLARRDRLEQVGGFDERYFLYWEDADLCRRLRTHGYRIRYVPGARAVHAVGQSSRTAQASAIRAFHDSAYLYYTTHVSPARFSPARVLARALLAARCWMSLRHVRP